MKTKQDMLAIRETTGRRLRLIRRGRKWDDVINELIDCFLQNVRCIQIKQDELGTGKCNVSGLTALEIRRGDIVNLYVIGDNEDDIKEQYAMVKDIKKVTMINNQAMTTMEYEVVKL